MDTKEKLKKATEELTLQFVSALTNAGESLGLGKEAGMIADGTVSGSAKLVSVSDNHPIDLVDRVCSPGGTTIEGLLSLKKDGFEGIITEKVEKKMSE